MKYFSKLAVEPTFFYYRIRVSKALAAERAWQFAQKSCAPSIVRSIPLSLWKRKSCSAEASTIYESHLHRTKVSCTNIFCAICQAHSAARAFDTRIIIGNSVARRTHEVSKPLFCHFFAIIPFIGVNIIIFSSFLTYNMSYCDGKIYVV